jgi:hypothetical protein
LKPKIGLYAGAFAFALAASAPGLAQPVPPPYPGPVPPGYEAGLPPQEVNAIVRSTGLRPLGPPMRHGPAYVVRAIDPDGEEVRVIINARMGRITKVIPVTLPRYALMPPSGRPPGRIAVVPDGYGPDGLEARPPIGPGGPPTGSVPAMNAPQDPAAETTPPLPRPRPKVAATVPPATSGGANDNGAKGAAPQPPPAEFDE